MNPFTLFSANSAATVVLLPEWSSKLDGNRRVLADRSTTGKLYDYKYAVSSRFSLAVVNVSSGDRALISSWWLTSTPLYFVGVNSADTPARVVIANDDEPLAEVSPPYIGEYRGTIELEGY